MSNLLKCYPDWYDNTKGGIFKDLYATYGTTFTWLSNHDALDTEYYGNHSGDKVIAPLLDKFVAMNVEAQSTTPYKLTSAQRSKLAAIIATTYKDNWERLFALTQLEYNPIENYSMEETETPNISHKHKVSEDYKEKTERSIDTDITNTTVTNASAKTYGFNSPVAVPSGESEGGSTVTTEGDAADNKETTERTQEGYTEDTETGTRGLTRSGNIGVTTSQQMLQSSIDIYTVWNFYNDVYNDIDKILTISIYK